MAGIYEGLVCGKRITKEPVPEGEYYPIEWTFYLESKWIFGKSHEGIIMDEYINK